VPDRERQPFWWYSLLFPLASGAIAAYALQRSSIEPFILLAAGGALAVAGFISVPTSIREHLDTSTAVAAAIPFLFRIGDAADLPGIIGVYAAGLAISWVVRLTRGEDQRRVAPIQAGRLVGFSAYALVFSWVSQLRLVQLIEDQWRDVVPLIAGMVVWILLDAAISIVVLGQPRQHSPKYLALAAFKDINVMVGLMATGALFGIAYPSIGWLALGAAALPYAFAHSAFRRLQATRNTYRQTIRALARIPEVAGLSVDGHADRTTDLALAVAKDLGLTPAQVENLEFAALMHDIGRITLTEPSIVREGYTEDDIARWGAEIIAQAPYLDRVADYVRRLNDPYRKPGEQIDPSVSVLSKIIRVSSGYDHAVRERRLSPLQAMEVLHQGAAYDYDPAIVASLRRVLELRGTFHPVTTGAL
jgi:hypothetical protein